MRLNDRELVQVCNETPTFEGRLNYRPPGGNFGQSGYKERWFRLRCNLLFYFRLSDTGKVESEPSGLFVLENSSIQLEQSSSIPFAFSIIFKDEPYKKHLFSGRSDSNIQAWVNSLKQCTYEYLRSQRILLQKKITLKTGKIFNAFYDYRKNHDKTALQMLSGIDVLQEKQDPLLMYPYNEGAIRDFELLEPVEAQGQPQSTRTATPLLSSNQHKKPPHGMTFHSHLIPVPPPRSSSPKSAIRQNRPPPPIPSQPIEAVKAPSLVSSVPKESVKALQPVLVPTVQPLMALPPMSSSPKAPSRPPPRVPSSEINLIDL